MGGMYQLVEMLAVALCVLLVWLLIAFLIGKLFKSKIARRRIVLTALGIYVLSFICYFGYIAFLLSGNLNSN